MFWVWIRDDSRDGLGMGIEIIKFFKNSIFRDVLGMFVVIIEFFIAVFS